MTLDCRAVIYVTIFFIAIPADAGQPRAEPAKPDSGAPPAAKATDPASKLSAQERLAASAKVYLSAKTYRDEGALFLRTDQDGKVLTRTVTFATAFERDGRFRWQFRTDDSPGPSPTQRATIWSTDGKSFDYFWTHNDQLNGHYPNIDLPRASAAGISIGAPDLILPLLGITDTSPTGGNMTIDLLNPVDAGTEKIDGIECVKIQGKRKWMNASVTPGIDSTITLWISDDGLIHKQLDVTEFATRKLPATETRPESEVRGFTAVRTITLKPFINELNLDDSKFVPDEKNPAPQTK